MDPLISIITPSFQQARFLRACIDSVLSQDYPEVEYIINDGGSDDGSVEILKSYGDRITWTSGPDGGQAARVADQQVEAAPGARGSVRVITCSGGK